MLRYEKPVDADERPDYEGYGDCDKDDGKKDRKDECKDDRKDDHKDECKCDRKDDRKDECKDDRKDDHKDECKDDKRRKCKFPDKDKCTLPPPVVKMIQAAIDDELGAVAEYAQLARLFRKDPVLQAWIASVAGDEYGHARAFAMLLAAAGCSKPRRRY